MIFKGYGNTIVWDVTTDKALCQFMDGIFKTDSVEVAEKLKQLGYEYEPEDTTAPKKEIKKRKR